MTAAYTFGRFEFKPASRQLLVEGQPAALGARAFDVLLALIERRERLVTKDELLDLAWPGLVVEENNLQVQISGLRKILGERIIRTVSGWGYQFTAEITRSDPSGPGLIDARGYNLPQPLTRFIGHEADLDEYEKIIATSRLVTLTGVGGCGKTRLAIELALRVLPRFVHGVWFVDLAPMADAARLPTTVARTLGLTERPGHSIVETLCEHLAGQQILLVLDNCEHLVSACAVLVQNMLGRAGQLKVLATSREGLGVPGEHTLRVRSLTCPSPDPYDVSDQYQASEAVQLFVDRARLVHPGFALDAATAPAVAEICRRLDGIPLAIELAAARTKILSVNELRQRLDDRFRLLVGGSRMALPRQQTLLATIKWSFDLLTPDERQLLQRLSVFSGGWTLNSAVAVAGANAAQFEMLEQLTRLVDKSLVVTHCDERGLTRYSMLETVRQYGRETLATTVEMETTTKRHLEYFVALAERLEPAFVGSEHKDAVEQLAPEFENMVQALNRCEGPPIESELGVRLAATLGQFWLLLGLVELGCRLTTEALSRQGAEGPSPARARALLVAMRLAFFLGRYEAARDWGKECIGLARLLHDEHVAAGALAFLGAIAIEFGDTTSAIAHGEESLRLARKHTDAEQTRRALNMLGEAHRASGNFELARPFYEECLANGRDHRDSHSTAFVACNLARTYISLGEVRSAWPPVLEAIDLSAEDKYVMEAVLEVVTGLAAVKGHWPWAARMLGAAEAALELLGHKRQRVDEDFFARIAAEIRNSQTEVEFEAAYGVGHAWTMEQAIEEARIWLEKAAPDAQSNGGPIPTRNSHGQS